MCSICLNEMTNKMTLKCNHSFCKECIFEWLESKCSCPLCRNETIKQEIMIENDLMTETEWKKTEDDYKRMVSRLNMIIDCGEMTDEIMILFNKMTSDFNRIERLWILKKQDNLEQKRIRDFNESIRIRKEREIREQRIEDDLKWIKENMKDIRLEEQKKYMNKKKYKKNIGNDIIWVGEEIVRGVNRNVKKCWSGYVGIMERFDKKLDDIFD